MSSLQSWVDPRVADISPVAAEAYLRANGWDLLPETPPHFREYEHPKHGPEGRIVRVPLRKDGRDYQQRIAELISDLAVAEGRHPVTILDLMLRGTPTNGVLPVAENTQTKPKT